MNDAKKLNCAFLATDIKIVMDNIDTFIIPENQKAIEHLWNMNILTRMTNNYDNDTSWIILGVLDKENMEIFNDIKNNNKCKNIGIKRNSIGIEVFVKPGTKDTYEDFLPYFSYFKFQDVQKDGYMTIEEFYKKYTDCWKIIHNPNFVLEPRESEYPTFEEYLAAYSNWLENIVPKRIAVVDETKLIKPLEEYLADANLLEYYDAEEEKIFFNKRLYDGHMRYKNYVKQKNSSNGSGPKL